MFSSQLQKYNPIIIVPNFLCKNYEKHRGGAMWQGARSPREWSIICFSLSFAPANIVTNTILPNLSAKICVIFETAKLFREF
jgi:hypothetical protein